MGLRPSLESEDNVFLTDVYRNNREVENGQEMKAA